MNNILDLSFLEDWDFVNSIGDYKQKKACAMSAAVAAWRVSQGVDMNGATDELDCVCPVIRKLVIARNDRTIDPDERKKWALSIIPKIIDTNLGLEVSIKRAEFCAKYAVRVVAADALEKAGITKHAQTLKSLPDSATLREYKAVANAAAAAATAAAAAAYDAAAADYAAAAAATAAAAAAYDAAYNAAADAADDADDAAAAAAAADAADAADDDAAAAAYNTAAAAAAAAAAYNAADIDPIINNCLDIQEY